MYLSSLYSKQTEEPALELAVVQLNINEGYNEELKKNCESLFGYMKYVEKVSRYRKEMELEEAHMQLIREEGREEGTENVLILVNRLLSENRLADLDRAAKDKEYLKSLME